MKPQCFRVRSWKSHCIRVYNLDLFLFRNTFIFTNYNEKFKNSKGTKGYMVLEAMSNMQHRKCDIQTATRPSYFLILNYDNRNTNIPYITLQILTYVMFLSVRHFKIFQPDRKAFFKNLPWKKQHHQKHSCLLHGVEVGNITIKKGFIHSSAELFLNIYP